MSESIFDKVAKSRPTKGGAFIQPGDYLYTILRVKLNQGGHKGDSVALEFLVDEANARPDEKPPNAPGSKCSAVHNFKYDSTPGNIKAFALAVLGLEDHEVTDAELAATLKEMVSDAQPFRGRRVRNSTYPWTTREGKKLDALNSFEHYPQTDEEIAARRAELDSGDVGGSDEKAEPAASALDKFKKK